MVLARVNEAQLRRLLSRSDSFMRANIFPYMRLAWLGRCAILVNLGYSYRAAGSAVVLLRSSAALLTSEMLAIVFGQAKPAVMSEANTSLIFLLYHHFDRAAQVCKSWRRLAYDAEIIAACVTQVSFNSFIVCHLSLRRDLCPAAQLLLSTLLACPTKACIGSKAFCTPNEVHVSQLQAAPSLSLEEFMNLMCMLHDVLYRPVSTIMYARHSGLHKLAC
jgi:hypothetical protein